jgi:hypothetical protein
LTRNTRCVGDGYANRNGADNVTRSSPGRLPAVIVIMVSAGVMTFASSYALAPGTPTL